MDNLHKAETGSNARHAGDGCPVSDDGRPKRKGDVNNDEQEENRGTVKQVV
jgi:hypothetical protein